MYHPQKLTIYLSSYRDGMGREAGKSPSMSKLTGKWSAEVASASRKTCGGPTLSGAPASMQAVTKVNRRCSVVTKANDRTGFVGNGEVEPIVSGRRLTSVWKQWLCAHTGSSGVKASSMHTHTCAETWEVSMSPDITEMWSSVGQRISTQCEIEGNAQLETSDEAVVVMMTKTLQLCRSEGPLLLRMFPYRKGDA